MSDFIDMDTYFLSQFNPYYQLNDGKVYNKDTEKFVTKDSDEDYKKFLETGNKPLSIGDNGYTKEQLINTVLKFYKWNVGECLLSLEELKAKRLSEVEAKSALFENNLNKDMYFTSSLGFKCNGDRRTRSNLEDLITFFDMQASGEPKVIAYRDYDNHTQNLTKEQLTTLLTEHITNGQALYTQKWTLQDAITKANSIDELNRVKIEFVFADFSAKKSNEKSVSLSDILKM